MSWSAHLTHTATGLAITFAAPVSRLDLTPDVAEHFASLIAIEARHRLRGVVAALDDDRQSGVSSAELPESVPIRVIGNGHPLCCDDDCCLNGDHHA